MKAVKWGEWGGGVGVRDGAIWPAWSPAVLSQPEQEWGRGEEGAFGAQAGGGVESGAQKPRPCTSPVRGVSGWDGTVGPRTRPITSVPLCISHPCPELPSSQSRAWEVAGGPEHRDLHAPRLGGCGHGVSEDSRDARLTLTVHGRPRAKTAGTGGRPRQIPAGAPAHAGEVGLRRR